jgi:acetyltransferase-like isoleucine patch superfamily enzyme
VSVLEHDWFPVAVPDNVQLGDGSWLYSSYAFLHYRSRRPAGFRTGRNCGVYIGTMLDLGPEAEVTVGDFSILNGCVIVTNGSVEIGSCALVAHEVTIAGRPFAAPPGEHAQPDPPIVIGDDAWIGVRATVLGGAVIGRGAIIGAATLVDSAVPDYAIVAGNPARIVGQAAPRAARRQGPAADPSKKDPGSSLNQDWD